MIAHRLDAHVPVPLTIARAPILQRKCRCGNHATAGGECESCRRARTQDRADTSGQPLDQATRALVEPRFGRDFSQVRVHADSAAGDAAARLNARAFTVGQHMHFGAGEYDPRSLPGMRLLAHELAHTVQQSGVGPGAAQRSSAVSGIEDGRLEHEADHAAEQVLAGQPAPASASVASALPQREDKNKTPPPAKVVAPVAPTKGQKKMIDAARRAAAIRTQTARFKASGVAGVQEYLDAKRLAQIKFDWADPNMDQIDEVLSGMGGGLISVDVKVAGPGDPECGPRSGYVRGHAPPIVLCSAFFADPANNEGRIRTMVHEMAHVKGVGSADTAEQYYQIFDCTSKGEFGSADAWANYVHCLSGQTPDKPEQLVVPVPKGKPQKPAKKP